jgi:hypothetical protein
MSGSSVVRTSSHGVVLLVGRLGSREQATDGWRDKKRSPPLSQATDVAWLRAGASAGSRTARRSNVRKINHRFGTAVSHGLSGWQR